MITENEISKSAILAHLERILESPEFAQSERMRRFLRLVVEYGMEGRSAELKEYLIATTVFDRKSSFDSRLDPIVRVEARRLRTKLAQYYERDACIDEIEIQLCKGTYAAQFSKREAANAAAAVMPSRSPAAAIAVVPFANVSGEAENDYFSDGLAQELILGLTRVPGAASGGMDVRRSTAVGNAISRRSGSG